MPVGPSRVVSVFSTFREPLVAAARVADDWGLFTKSLSQPLPETIAKTELPLWSPARFTGPRSIESVADIWALVLDVDEDPIPDAHELAQALFGFRAVCYSSSSASAAAPRWRAAIELSRPVTAEEYTRAANAFTSLLPFAVGSASRDPARQWYFPRDGAGGHFEWIALEGEPLDVDELLAMTPADLPAAPAAARARGETQHYPGDITEPAERARRRELYTEYLRTEAPARGPERRGQGDVTLFDVVQRGAYDLALPVDDVLELVREHYDPRCSPQWGNDLEERVHHKAHDAKTTSTRPRAEPLPADLVHRSGDRNIATAIPAAPATDDETAKLEGELKITWGKWDEPLPPAVYTISPIVPEATLGVIVAKGSSLKTWLVLSMLASVARGVPWLGQFPVTQGAAMLVDFESGRDIIHERVQYLRTYDAPHLGIASFPNARIDDPNFWIKLANVVRARGVKLIAIDSFAAGATSVDENDAKSADPLHYAARFIEATIAVGCPCTVVLIHHAKKGGEGGDERDIVRGSGAIFGAADWIYTMVPQDEDRTKMLVRCIKAFRKKTDDFVVALTVDGLVLDVAESRTDETPKAQQRILETLRAVPGLHTLVDICRAAKVKSGTFTKEDIASLVSQRRIVYLPKQGYLPENDAARRARIIAATRTPGLSTPQALANAAHVHVDEVHELTTQGVIVRSGTGFIANA